MEAELKQRAGKRAAGGAASQLPLDSEEEAKPALAAAAAPAAAPAAAAAFPHTLALVLLAGCLVATYSLESLAPTLDYVGRDIMLAVQVVHLAATAAFGVRQDWVVAAALANLAAFTRFWRIEDPQSIIFDEVSGRGLEGFLPPAAQQAPPFFSHPTPHTPPHPTPGAL